MQKQILKTREEKKDFLESDFLDRLIRIEQRVSAKFGKLVKYTDTYCYKNLIPENRKRYEKYLKTKKKKKLVFVVSLVLFSFGILFLANRITGNVVKEGVGETGFQTFFLVLFAFLAGLLIWVGIFFLIRFNRKRKFDSLFNHLEKIASKRKIYK